LCLMAHGNMFGMIFLSDLVELIASMSGDMVIEVIYGVP
jgi:hypothetical protein